MASNIRLDKHPLTGAEPLAAKVGIALIQHVTGDERGHHFVHLLQRDSPAHLYGASFEEVSAVAIPSNGAVNMALTV